jgi:hypothetical protein
VLNLLSTGAIISLILLLIIQAVRFLASLVNRYVRGGGLQRHRQLALVGVVLAAALAFGLPRLFPQYQAWVFLALAVVFPFLSAIRILIFNHGAGTVAAQLAFS